MAARPDRRRYPSATTAASALFVLAVFGLLHRFGAGGTGNTAFGDGRFRIWAAVATVSLLVWVLLFQRGVGEIRALSGPWRRSRRWWAGNLAAYAVLGVLTAVAIGLVVSGGSASVPIRHFSEIVDGLTALGWCAAGPWILMVWMGHERVRDLAVATAAVGAPAPGREDDPVALIARGAVEIRERVERSALALAVLGSTSVLTTGALRCSLVDAEAVAAEDFSSWWILGYGALFSVVVAAVVFPLLFAWRAQALGLVDRAPGSRTVGALRIRRPLSVLSVLAPLATSVPTAFLVP
ncbi:hypothetical protein EDD29_3030 [Actinocorallia herbida]|uniref:Uncharacterized protein n=1 Tax=Actinocorallia herbida TaxID=58109 RepID=A0A3N1CW85_9ACTN|nr:hypothetical protein [Actinocorallia herbida]ROO85485.1 hypothetical protein EDD29_3030 [Actinocorallia herbida]